MYIDAGSILSSAQAVTATAVSTGTYDTAGLGIGQPVTMRPFGGTTNNFGEDVGGGGPAASAPQLIVTVPTAFTAGGAATLQIQLQCAVDVNNTGLPVTWKTIMATDTIPVASLTAGDPARPLASFTIPDRYQGQGFPRFYRLNYVVATGPMLTGALNAALLTGIDDVPFYPANF